MSAVEKCKGRGKEIGGNKTSDVIKLCDGSDKVSGQRTNKICVNNTEFHCDENMSDCSNDNDANKNCRDSSDSESDEIVPLIILNSFLHTFCSVRAR